MIRKTALRAASLVACMLAATSCSALVGAQCVDDADCAADRLCVEGSCRARPGFVLPVDGGVVVDAGAPRDAGEAFDAGDAHVGDDAGVGDDGGGEDDGGGGGDAGRAGDGGLPDGGAHDGGADGGGLLPVGAPCADGAGCASGFCVDGVCCAEACDGACERCARSGACVADVGAPCGAELSCGDHVLGAVGAAPTTNVTCLAYPDAQATGSCVARGVCDEATLDDCPTSPARALFTCDGECVDDADACARGALVSAVDLDSICVLGAQTPTCTGRTCESGANHYEQDVGCDAQGRCGNIGPQQDCFPYRCDASGDACRTQCFTDAECQTFRCDDTEDRCLP